MAEKKTRQSLLVTLLDKKNINLEAERQKAFMARDNILASFERTHLRDENGKYRKMIKNKSYVDGSKYDGEFSDEKRHGVGKNIPSL